MDGIAAGQQRDMTAALAACRYQINPYVSDLQNRRT